MIHQPARLACRKPACIEPRMVAARTEPTIATPSDWPSCRLEEFMPEAMPAWVLGTPDMKALVIGELTMPAPTPNRPYVMIRYAWSVLPVSRDSAALLMVRAAPAMTSGIRGPRLATLRPASAAHRAITMGIGRIVSPAWRPYSPRTSCRYNVDKKRNPAIAPMAQTALMLAPAKGTLRKNRMSIMGSARRGS